VQALSTAGLWGYPCPAAEMYREIQLYDPELRAELFDSLVRPILLHGAEIWAVLLGR
jgi:hypothetical protein